MKTLHLSIILFGIIIGTLIPYANAQSINLGGPARSVNYQFSQMASSGNNIYAVYQQNAESEAQNHVFFRKSSDGGSSFFKTK